MSSASNIHHRLQECERQHRQVAALHAVGEAVNRSLDLDEVLRVALERVIEVLELDAGSVRLIQDGQLVLREARAVSAEFVAIEQTMPLGVCQCGQAALRGEVLITEDLRLDPDRSLPCACERFATVLSVPVQTTDQVVGIVHVASRRPRAFDQADRELLTAIGRQIGIAIERAQFHQALKALNATLEARVAERTRELEAARQALAQQADALRRILAEERRIEERTRARIAHDLHDGVQQLIVGALFEAQAARDLLATQPDLAGQRLASAQALLRRIEAEMRRAIYSLRPVALDTHGLVPALRELVAGFSQAGQIPCGLRVTGTPQRFDPDAEVAAFRIVQEALNNLAVHSRATYAEVSVHFAGRQVVVEVSDNGVGFDLAAISQAPRSHLGLIGMQERAESIGGSLAIWSQPGCGTRVTLVAPLGEPGVSGGEGNETDPGSAGG
ncbi:MAG: GAF domain-containing sensor histidine kinase [Caldilineales bacterium]|nr:GAF domain-containing sensor histidine kinase [Caldilineales bacterium]MDW8317348.1 GAF domain-containing sensor histidine kinase [Anaerolineae bacterium]